MFGSDPGPHLFGLPPGADFPAHVAAGLRARLSDQPPEALARVTVFVNTRRMQRRLRELLAAQGALLLPRIRLVTDLADDPTLPIPAAVPKLRRKLEIARLVLGLIESDPDLAPRSSAFGLAESLTDLLDEMQGEGVDPQVLHRLDLSRMSDHWERARRFLSLVEPLFRADPPDTEARQRRAAVLLADRWSTTPPADPIVVAGSTGSRGATALLMAAVARLPLGAVILPGVDFEMQRKHWDELGEGASAMPCEDHPQYRFARLAEMLERDPGAIEPWDADPPPCPARNRLVSLALRPAPATDAWMEEGPRLGDLGKATADMTLIEAPSQRLEATAIALRLREAAETGQVAALVTPDRMLTRRVTAHLDRWGIEPDDSAGRPLALSPPGRLLLQVAALVVRPVTSEALLALLKHPLCHSGSGRGDHLRHAHDLELDVRSRGPLHPDRTALQRWGARRDDRVAWADWVAALLDRAAVPQGERLLTDHVARHLDLAESFAAGPTPGDAAELWAARAGDEARKAMDELAAEAGHGCDMTAGDYLALVRQIFEGRDVRDPVRPHPGVMIWGTLEARVQGADLVILGGLNDGIWPTLPPPDPWMNRRMRLDSGLLLPERRVGLAAHDFQQAIAAREVVLSRANRSADAETVPSRWLNRMTTLLSGLAETGGPEALAAMRERGAALVAQAQALDDARELSVVAAHRPAPRPPVEARPKRLSVTDVETLIRDPYAIYARHVLGLRPLDPLRRTPDARLRGSALHKVLEVFVRDVWPVASNRRAAFHETVARVLAEEAPWPATRAAWAARLHRIAPWFLEGEALRQLAARPTWFEVKGELEVGATGLTLVGKADRIDVRDDGAVAIYDYKTGTLPSAKEQSHFSKQLPLLASLAAGGAFAEAGTPHVATVGFIGMGSSPDTDIRIADPEEMEAVWSGLERLIRHYSSRNRGYLSRRAPRREQGGEAGGDYDHLARYGEWEGSDRPVPEDVG